MTPEKAIALKMIDDYLGPQRSDGRKERLQIMLNTLEIGMSTYRKKREAYGNFTATDIARLTTLTGNPAYIDYLKSRLQVKDLFDISIDSAGVEHLTVPGIRSLVSSSNCNHAEFVNEVMEAISNDEISVQNAEDILESLRPLIDTLQHVELGLKRKVSARL